MQIPDEVRKSVVFLTYKDKTDFKYRMVGTGFLVGFSIPEKDVVFNYLVTARHVIASLKEADTSLDGQIWVRANKKSEGVEYISIPLDNWFYHPDDNVSVDVAVIPFGLNPSVYDHLAIASEMFLTNDVMIQESIGVGDEIFMTGLFINHFGNTKNIPIVRVGNIAALNEEPVRTKKFGNMDAYLVETRSIGGLSGSPVFVHLSGSRMSPDRKTTLIGRPARFYLLGLMHGHWDLLEFAEDTIIEDVPNKKGINMGIGIVVPFSRILETLRQDKFMKYEAEWKEEESKL